MFDIKRYKKFSRIQLRRRWGLSVLMTVITLLVIALFQIKEITIELKLIFNAGSVSEIQNTFDEGVASGLSNFLDNLRYWLLFLSCAILSFAQILTYLEFSKSPERVSVSKFFSNFSSWPRAVLSALWCFFWVFLWSMLFIIPGIVKSFSYSQMFYLLAEYPNLSVQKAMKISIRITDGHKSDLFLMMLSFVPWGILSAITAGVGFVFLIPYMQMTMVNAYHGMLKDAFQEGRLTLEDLGQSKENAQ